MNKADSERIAASLEKRGYRPAGNIKEADLVVVNMCSVRQPAVDRVFGISMKLKELGSKPKKLILTGCILKKDRRKFEKTFDEIWDHEDYLKEVALPRHKPVGFVSISNGCDNFCAYCVVPFARGKLVCSNPEKIIKEVKALADKGFQEIWLLGQNVNDYRFKTTDFADLVKLVEAVPGNFKFFFTSPHPKNFSEKLIKTLAKCSKFSKRLNIPVQSGDNIVLKKMRRNYTAGQYKNLIKKIRRAIPDINLSTDAIVGFPGETKKQFQNTVKLFKDINFDIAYVSKYSARLGTAASKLKDDITLAEKKRRAKILMKLVRHPNI